MKSYAVVLGNGPGLTAEAVAQHPDAFRVGVNRSFEVAWSSIVCSADLGFRAKHLALLGDYDPPWEWVFKHDLVVAPKWATPSGPFAVWYASEVLGFDRIVLLGFGGPGHFYAHDDVPRERHNFNLNRVVGRISASVTPVPPCEQKHDVVLVR